MLREIVEGKKRVRIQLKPLRDSTLGKHSRLAARAFNAYTDGEIEVDVLDGKYYYLSGVVEPEWIEKVLK